MARRFRFPSTVGPVVVGVVLSQLGRIGPEFLEPLHAFELPPAVVFFVLLPALVFESAFNLEGRALKENLAPVLTMAVPGLLISTGLLGALMHWTTGMSWPLALLLGTVLSATDPAGVTALFRQLGAPKRLSILVEGESLFNDATSIVASRIVWPGPKGSRSPSGRPCARSRSWIGSRSSGSSICGASRKRRAPTSGCSRTATSPSGPPGT